MFPLKIAAIATLIIAWVLTRQSKRLRMTDVFVLGYLLLYVPYWIFNPTGKSQWNDLVFSDDVIRSAETGLLMFTFVAALTLVVNRYVFRLNTDIKRYESRQLTGLLQIVACIAAVLILGFLGLFADFREFRIEKMRFDFTDLGSME